MSRHARYLTHIDRAIRRDAIRQAIAAGTSIAVLAERYGLASRYIQQIAQDAGLNRSTGRPRGRRNWRECPPHLAADYDFMVRRKRIPADEARQILEGRGA